MFGHFSFRQSFIYHPSSLFCKNVLILICLWRKSDLVSQPSSSWVPKNQRMLPRILDVPRRNFHRFFSVELYSCHGRSDADAWSQSTEQEELQCRFSSTATPYAWRKMSGMRPETEERPFRILKVLQIETRWKGYFFFLFLVKKRHFFWGKSVSRSQGWISSLVGPTFGIGCILDYNASSEMLHIKCFQTFKSYCKSTPSSLSSKISQ